MGNAIGLSVAASCEIIYWITLKPLVKWMMTTKLKDVSPKYKTLYKMSFIFALLLCMAFCMVQLYSVYLTFLTRTRDDSQPVLSDAWTLIGF